VSRQAILLLITAALLLAASVLPWAVRPVWPELYRDVFHMVGTVQGGLTCGLAGVLLWRVPALTDGRPPKWWLTAMIAVMCVATVVVSFLRHLLPYDILLGVGQGTWLLALVSAGTFALRRFRAANGRSVAVTWYVLAAATGIAGAVLLSAYSTLGSLGQETLHGLDREWLKFIGRGWLLQCLFLGLIIGWMHDHAQASGLLRNTSAERSRMRALACMAALVASVPLELWSSTRLGLSVRLVATLYGLHTAGFFANRLTPAHIATGSIPLGYMVGATMPRWRTAGLHLVFIGGFVVGPLLWLAATNAVGKMSWLRRTVALLGLALVLRSAADIMTSLDNRVGVVAMAASAFVAAMGFAVVWLLSLSIARR